MAPTYIYGKEFSYRYDYDNISFYLSPEDNATVYRVECFDLSLIEIYAVTLNKDALSLYDLFGWANLTYAEEDGGQVYEFNYLGKRLEFKTPVYQGNMNNLVIFEHQSSRYLIS